MGAVVFDERDRVLLVRRGRPPLQGEWSIPGGKVEGGETLHAALVREVREETGIDIEILALVDVVDTLPHLPKEVVGHYVLIDYAARAAGGVLAAGSDAREAMWVEIGRLDEVPMWSETRRVIHEAAKGIAQ